MNSEASELIEMLRDVRECAKFLSELGVETIALPADHEIKANRTLPQQPTGAERFESAASAKEQTTNVPSKSVTSAGTKSLASLFEETTPPSPVVQSRESLEDVWRDIGDCTRSGVREVIL